MAESSTKKRQSLFDLYSRHVTLYEPDKRDIFFCPVCLRGFNREALAGPDPSVNLAHIIPECLGGTACTLTCSECNSRGGSGLEAALLDRFVAEDFVAGVSRTQARLSGPFRSISVEMQLSPDRNQWSIYLPPQSKRADLAALHRYFTQQTESQADVEFSLTPRYRHQPRQEAAAVYQSAYLLLFSYFGYEFVMHRHFAPLREQILRPEEDIWRTRIAIPEDESAPALLGPHRQAVVFVREPPAILAVLRLRPRDGRERVLAVVLPSLDEPHPRGADLTTSEGTIIPYRPDALIHTKFYLARLWRWTRRAGRGGC